MGSDPIHKTLCFLLAPDNDGDGNYDYNDDYTDDYNDNDDDNDDDDDHHHHSESEESPLAYNMIDYNNHIGCEMPDVSDIKQIGYDDKWFGWFNLGTCLNDDENIYYNVYC